MNQQVIADIAARYQAAQQRAICLDYDGTLVDFAPTPQAAVPPPDLLQLLADLCADPRNTIMIVSGRASTDLHEWFGALPLFLMAEHGHFVRQPGRDWQAASPPQNHWQAMVRVQLEAAVRAVPQSFIEEKQTALVWHYRRAAADQAEVQLEQLIQALPTPGVHLLPGDKVLEVRGVASSKAAAFAHLPPHPDFILVAGDDTTDEAMFAAAPDQTITIKVRPTPTQANYTIASPSQMLRLLRFCLRYSAA